MVAVGGRIELERSSRFYDFKYQQKPKTKDFICENMTINEFECF
jgi:hypothetical protein